jgi:hypothetical protein
MVEISAKSLEIIIFFSVKLKATVRRFLQWTHNGDVYPSVLVLYIQPVEPISMKYENLLI